MRVLYVNQTAAVSGAERSLLDIVNGLGDAVDPVVACPPGELAEAVKAIGVRHEPIVGTQASFRFHPLHTSRGLAEIGRSAGEVRRLAAETGADLVHANTTRAALLAILRRRKTPPILAHVRDWTPDGFAPRRVNGVLTRGADLVVTNSQYVAGQFEGLKARRPVRALYDPVDISGFDPNADPAPVRREFAIGRETVVLAVVAQLTPWKAQDDAIRALAALPTGGPDTALLLAGSAVFSGEGTKFDNQAYVDGLHRLASELGVADRVHFLGERADVPAVLAATDIVLLPSWREAYGRIAVEGLAMGVPVVATEVGGPAEIVRPGVDGLLLPPKSPDLWARELGPLVDSASQRAEMGANGVERAQNFSVPTQMRELLAVYAELTGKSPGAAL